MEIYVLKPMERKRSRPVLLVPLEEVLAFPRGYSGQSTGRSCQRYLALAHHRLPHRLPGRFYYHWARGRFYHRRQGRVDHWVQGRSDVSKTLVASSLDVL